MLKIVYIKYREVDLPNLDRLPGLKNVNSNDWCGRAAKLLEKRNEKEPGQRQ